jgi:hypothetical protein
VAIAYNTLDIMVTSWRDTGIYHVDFGNKLGYPVDMQVEDVAVGGMFIVLPRRRTPNEIWELQATADPDTMRYMCENTTWGFVGGLKWSG